MPKPHIWFSRYERFWICGTATTEGYARAFGTGDSPRAAYDAWQSHMADRGVLEAILNRSKTLANANA